MRVSDSNASILYLRLRRKVRLRASEPIRLGHVAQLIADPTAEQALLRLPLIVPHKNDGDVILIDMLQIVAKVKEIYPQMLIEHFGEPHTLVELATKPRKPNLALTLLVWFLLFIGSGLAIMNFHADVSMLAVHQRIYELVTGDRIDHPLLLQIPYSIGIGIGMMIFFNHLFRKKINEEPSPLEVEMFMYEENVNKYIILDEYEKIRRKGEE
jgi:stage V sporulation protein AA